MCSDYYRYKQKPICPSPKSPVKVSQGEAIGLLWSNDHPNIRTHTRGRSRGANFPVDNCRSRSFSGGGVGGREGLGPPDGNHTVALLITLIITLREIIIEAIILWQLMGLMCAAESIVLYSAFKPK